MRIWGCVYFLPTLVLLLTLTGLSSAQDTNFAAGPQYLIPSGSPLFLQPIATPSMSFPSGLDQAPTSEAAGSTSRADEATLEAVSSVLEAQRKTALYSIYYGVPQVSVVEIAFSAAAEGEAASIPSSIFDSGVVQFTNPQALRNRGYGVTLAEAAAHAKARKASGHRVYTNEDVERLRPHD